MKNFLPVLAVMLSMSGIALSLAREEVRCYLGLDSAACERLATPETKPDTPETVKDSLSPSPSETIRSIEPNPAISPKPWPEKANPFTPPEIKPDNPPVVETKKEEKTIPIEPIPTLTPSPETTPQSIPLEVIPPPEP